MSKHFREKKEVADEKFLAPNSDHEARHHQGARACAHCHLLQRRGRPHLHCKVLTVTDPLLPRHFPLFLEGARVVGAPTSPAPLPSPSPVLYGLHGRPLLRLPPCVHSKDHFPSAWYSDNGEQIGTYAGHNGTVWSIDVTCEYGQLNHSEHFYSGCWNDRRVTPF